MKTFKKIAASLLALTLTASAFAVTAASETAPGYKLVNTYDETAGTITAELYVTGGYGAVGQVGFTYDPELITLTSLNGETDGISDYVKTYNGTGYTVTATRETNKLDNLINEEEGEFFFAWYTGAGRNVNVDATEKDAKIISFKFEVNSGVETADLEGAGTDLLNFASSTPSDKNVAGYLSGVYIGNEENTAFRNSSNARNPITLSVEYVGLDIEEERETVVITVVDEDGKAVEGAYVKIGSTELQTNSKGQAEFEISGTYSVSYKHKKSDSYVTLTAGETTAVLSAPGKMSAPSVSTGTEKLTISWKAPSTTGGSDITKYEVSLTRNSTEKVYEFDADQTKATISDLVGNSKYTVKVRAVNAFGEGEYSNTVTATPSKSSSGGSTGGNTGSTGGSAGGSTTVVNYTVTYDVGTNGKIISGSKTESVKSGSKPTKVPTVQANAGYKFLGWAKAGGSVINPENVVINSATTFIAQYEAAGTSAADTVHKAYVTGYEDGTIRPYNPITRAEAVTLIARLSPDFVEGKTYSENFSDVASGDWYANYVGFAVDKGYVNGYEDGTFKPTNNINRAEFATIICRMLGYRIDTTKTFTDVPDANAHWAFGYISTLKANSIITGYEDGTFLPANNITRAEAITILNRANGRNPDAELAKAVAAANASKVANDLSQADWFFAQVIEASIEHEAGKMHK